MFSNISYLKALPLLSPYFEGRLGPYVAISFNDIGSAVVAHYPAISWYVMERVYLTAGPLFVGSTDGLAEQLRYNGAPEDGIRLHIKAWEAAKRILFKLNGFEPPQALVKGQFPLPPARVMKRNGDLELIDAQNFYEICYCPLCVSIREDIERQEMIAAGDYGDDDDDVEELDF